MQCRKCGAKPLDGVWLERVNKKGVEGIWECRPSCETRLPQDERLIAAIEHPRETSANENAVAMGPRPRAAGGWDMLTRERIEKWRMQGQTLSLRAMILPEEWTALCDMALRSLSLREQIIEECAKVCDEIAHALGKESEQFNTATARDFRLRALGANACTAAIRALAAAPNNAGEPQPVHSAIATSEPSPDTPPRGTPYITCRDCGKEVPVTSSSLAASLWHQEQCEGRPHE